MKFSFLPEEIKSEIDKELVEQEPLALARSNMAVNGHMGESFIVAYKNKFFFFTKAMGSLEFKKIEGLYPDISEMSVTNDTKNAVIEIQLKKQKHALKFAPIIEKSLNKVKVRWLITSLSPYLALFAALMYLASEDDDVSGEENDFILKLAKNDENVLTLAHNFYQEQSIETLYEVLSGCGEEQKFCIMANLLELAMCDGILHSQELKLIRRFAKSMNIEDDEYETIKQVMVMKNQIGILKK